VYALFALSNLACACATGFSMLLVARAFAGITGGVLGSVIMAIVSDVIPVARRGAATGTIMTAFSLAAVAGVPAGILLGARFGWFAPFVLLAGLSVLIWMGAMRIVPTLAEHLAREQPALGSVLPVLWRLLSNPRYLPAFVLTFVVMVSQMLVIPFISPMLVANRGVAPAQLSWLYMAGGAATFFTSRFIGRLADRHGSRLVFRLMVALSLLPILFVTHLPGLPFIALLLFFPVFMVVVSGRMVPMQALLTTVPEPANRGAFLSANSALQALGSGCGAWLGGLLLSSDATGYIEGYGVNGWLATALALLGAAWVGRVKSAAQRAVAQPVAAQPLGET
jgi:MFS transporter, DHA1 family, inner membrane transport protein